jgi:hypothetical protein
MEFLLGLDPFSLTMLVLLSNSTDASHPYKTKIVVGRETYLSHMNIPHRKAFRLSNHESWYGLDHATQKK